jgi:hypothetical protein
MPEHHSKMAGTQAFHSAKSGRVFGQLRKSAKMSGLACTPAFLLTPRRPSHSCCGTAAQAFRLQFIRPDHMLVLNEIREFRQRDFINGDRLTCNTE